MGMDRSERGLKIKSKWGPESMIEWKQSLVFQKHEIISHRIVYYYYGIWAKCICNLYWMRNCIPKRPFALHTYNNNNNNNNFNDWKLNFQNCSILRNVNLFSKWSSVMISHSLLCRRSVSAIIIYLILPVMAIESVWIWSMNGMKCWFFRKFFMLNFFFSDSMLHHLKYVLVFEEHLIIFDCYHIQNVFPTYRIHFNNISTISISFPSLIFQNCWSIEALHKIIIQFLCSHHYLFWLQISYVKIDWKSKN